MKKVTKTAGFYSASLVATMWSLFSLSSLSDGSSLRPREFLRHCALHFVVAMGMRYSDWSVGLGDMPASGVGRGSWSTLVGTYVRRVGKKWFHKGKLVLVPEGMLGGSNG